MTPLVVLPDDILCNNKEKNKPT